MDVIAIIILIFLVLSLSFSIIIGTLTCIFATKTKIMFKNIQIYILNIIIADSLKTIVVICLYIITNSNQKYIYCNKIVPIYNIFKNIGMFTLLELSIEMMICAKYPKFVEKYGKLIRPIVIIPIVCIYSCFMGVIVSIDFYNNTKNVQNNVLLCCNIKYSTFRIGITDIVLNFIIPSIIIISSWINFHFTIRKIELKMMEQIIQTNLKLKNLKILKKLDRIGIIVSLNYIVLIFPIQILQLSYFIYATNYNITEFEQFKKIKINWIESIFKILTTLILPINLLIFIFLTPNLYNKFCNMFSFHKFYNNNNDI